MSDADYLIGRSEMKKDIMDFIEVMAAQTLACEPENEKDEFFENKKAIWTTLQALKNTIDKGVPVKPEKVEQN